MEQAVRVRPKRGHRPWRVTCTPPPARSRRTEFAFAEREEAEAWARGQAALGRAVNLQHIDSHNWPAPYPIREE